MIAGGVAGAFAKTTTAPLSRLTILYQVSPILSMQIGSTVEYANTLSLQSACAKIMREEGFASFWRGNLTSVLHRFPYSAINFTSYESSKEYLLTCFGWHETPTVRLLCGAFSGCCSTFACYPLDLVRTRLTVSPPPLSKQPLPSGSGTVVCTSSGSSSGSSITAHDNNHVVSRGAGSTSRGTGSRILSTILSIIEKEGFGGLYRGLFVSLVVSVPNLAIGFSVYGSMKEKLIESLPFAPEGLFVVKDTLSLTQLGSMLSGAAAGISSSLITFPADVVRRRMQVMGLSSSPIKTSAAEEALRIWRAEGVGGLYRGIVPEILKVAPMVGVTFCAYEFVLRHLEASRKSW